MDLAHMNAFSLLKGKCQGLMENKKKTVRLFTLCLYPISKVHVALSSSLPAHIHYVCFPHSPKTIYSLGDSPQAFSIAAIPYLHLIASLIVYWVNRNNQLVLPHLSNIIFTDPSAFLLMTGLTLQELDVMLLLGKTDTSICTPGSLLFCSKASLLLYTHSPA